MCRRVLTYTDVYRHLVAIFRYAALTCIYIWTRCIVSPPPKKNQTNWYSDGSPLPLGQQLRGHRQPQVLPAVHKLRLRHLRLRARSRDRALHGLRKGAPELRQQL